MTENNKSNAKQIKLKYGRFKLQKALSKYETKIKTTTMDLKLTPTDYKVQNRLSQTPPETNSYTMTANTTTK